MDLQIVSDSRRRYAHAQPLVSINPKLGKIVIFQLAYDYIKSKARVADFEYVQTLIDNDDLTHFFIRPCSLNNEGAKKITLTGKTRVIVAKMLLNILNYQADETLQYPVTWNNRAEAIEIDLKNPMPMEKTRKVKK